MKRKFVLLMMILAMTATLVACGGGEETTISGMIVAVDGTVISLMEMDGNMGDMNFGKGERPERPEEMDGFQGFGNFNPEDFNGTMPEGGAFPQWGEGEMPEMPEGMMPPEGMTMPENGEMPDFGGEKGDQRPGFGGFNGDMETKNMDVAEAHISVEIDGGKASGSMEDIKPGTFVTLTVDGKGKVTYVLVSSATFIGGGRSDMAKMP